MGMMEHLPGVSATGGPPAESLAERRLSLPGGIVDAGGGIHRSVRVRELTGSDEERLFDFAEASGARRVTAFLARAIESVEGLDVDIDERLAAGLHLGDRDYVLLRLRQLDLGDAVHQVTRCPSCARKVDIDFLISELPVRRLDEARTTWTLPLATSADGCEHVLRVRLPTGADHAAVETLATLNPAAANTLLFSRVVLDVDGNGPPTVDVVRQWSLAARAALAAWLEERAPGPDLFLDLACPECRADMSYVFDLAAFFLPSE